MTQSEWTATLRLAGEATPGPWFVEHDERGYVQNIKAPTACRGPGAVGKHILRARSFILPSSQETAANAALIAAAPCLLRELQHLVRLLEPLERDGMLHVPGLATLNGARAALAKALPEPRQTKGDEG